MRFSFRMRVSVEIVRFCCPNFEFYEIYLRDFVLISCVIILRGFFLRFLCLDAVVRFPYEISCLFAAQLFCETSL
jgi:hypothetical protein